AHLLDPQSGRTLPSRARRQLGAVVIVKRGIDHAARVVILRIDPRLRDQFGQQRLEGPLALHAKAEEGTGTLDLDLRCDHTGRGPRRLLPGAAALQDRNLTAGARQPPRHRIADYAAPDYQCFHSVTSSVAART